MCCVGDTVMYGNQGVCKIIGTDLKKFGGSKVEYFVLQPIYDENSRVFIPLANENLVSKMHPVISREEIDNIINSIPDEETIWISEDVERKRTYQKIIVDGNRRELVRLIKTLHIHQDTQNQKGRKLHQSDDYILKQAEKLLYDEFAFVLEVNPDDVLTIVMEKLQHEPAISAGF